MTDKEWKELREWAKSLHCRKVRVSNKIFDGGCILVKDTFVRLIISRTGTLFSKTYEKIAENCTPVQITEIIRNLIDEVYYDRFRRSTSKVRRINQD